MMYVYVYALRLRMKDVKKKESLLGSRRGKRDEEVVKKVLVSYKHKDGSSLLSGWARGTEAVCMGAVRNQARAPPASTDG